MTTVTILRGIQASGKSTWAKAWVAEDPEHRFRSNRDDLRTLLGFPGRGTYEQEQRVTEWQRKIATSFLRDGYDVVWDDTNLRAKFVREVMLLARSMGAEVRFKDFPIDLDTAIQRDYKRMLGGKRSVGEQVIRDFYTRFTPKGKLPPIPELPEDAIAATDFAPHIHQNGLDHAITVDLDGTLAHMNGRGAFDPSLYHTDTFDTTVGLIAESYAQTTQCFVFVFTGRDEQYRDACETWLKKHDFQYDAMFMRPQGDTRNDAVIKNEIFENYIEGRYNVDFCLDDRDRVVSMLRSKGLKVLQVADGAF